VKPPVSHGNIGEKEKKACGFRLFIAGKLKDSRILLKCFIQVKPMIQAKKAYK